MKISGKFLTFVLAAISLAALSAADRGWFRRSTTTEVREALIQALAGPEGEYAAHAQYSAVIGKFGEVQPYVGIRMAESRHIAALERQLEKYGIKMPSNKYEGIVQAPETLVAAAKEAIASEERNIAMYDQLLEKVRNHPDLVRVFTNLRGASENGHLPAFKAALEKGGKLEKGSGSFCGMGCGACSGCCMEDDGAQSGPKGFGFRGRK